MRSDSCLDTSSSAAWPVHNMGKRSGQLDVLTIHDPGQVGVTGRFAGVCGEGMGLTSVVGLVVEEVDHAKRLGPDHVLARGAAQPGEVPVEILGHKAVSPADDRVVEVLPLRPQVVEVVHEA